MNPMSNTKRRFYFFGFLILFLIVTPLVIFYAMGYRLGFIDEFIVTERGGIYVQTSIPGTRIYINDELRDTTGIFNQEYLSQNIKPGRYFVRAINEEYRAWEKYVQVDAHRVTSLYPFLVPEIFEFEDIPATFEDMPVNATTTIEVPNPAYEQFASLFEVATSTDDVISNIVELDEEQQIPEEDEEEPETLRRVFGDVQVWYEDAEKKFYAEWLARGDFLPSYFCENGECLSPFVFLEVNSPVIHFDFYPGRDDVIIFAVEDGSVHAVEIDKRPQQTVIEIYRGEAGVDFRLVGRDTLVIIDGDQIKTTELTR